MNKVFMPTMTWREVEEALKAQPVVLFPLGSIEQHGPHAPVGDYRMAEILAVEAAQEAGNAVVLPVIPFGCSEYFKGFPGTLSVKAASLYPMIKDVCECVLNFGIDHLLFINGHKGNEPVIEHMARELREKWNVVFASVVPWNCLTPATNRALYGDRAGDTGHGSEPMGSLNSEFFPDQMRMDLAEPSQIVREYGAFDLSGPSRLKLNDVPVAFYQSYHEVTNNGVLGDPLLASAERGKKMRGIIVKELVAIIKAFRELDTKVRPGLGQRF